jgi:hypothetical protein
MNELLGLTVVLLTLQILDVIAKQVGVLPEQLRGFTANLEQEMVSLMNRQLNVRFATCPLSWKLNRR